MKQDFDKLSVETHLVTLNGLAQALSMMAESPSLDGPEQAALSGMADAIEAEFNALWRLVFGGDFPQPGDRKVGQSAAGPDHMARPGVCWGGHRSLDSSTWKSI